MNEHRAPLEKVCLPKSGRKGIRTVRLATGWLALVLYFLEYSPVGISATAFAGSLDSNHQVQLQAGERGLEVVLHHYHGCSGHHHGVIAQALTLFAQPATATNPDHVIQFGSADSFSIPTQILSPNSAQTEMPMPLAGETSIAVPNPAFASSQVPRPPPFACRLPACLCSTVLLI